MYKFQLANGTMAKIYFSHEGGKSATEDEPSRPPRSTKCRIVNSEGEVIGNGKVKPKQEIMKLLPPDLPNKYAQRLYGPRFKRLLHAPDGRVYALLQGDSFSRVDGRREALRQALKSLQRKDRKNAWLSVLGKIDTRIKYEKPAIDELVDWY